MKKSFAVAIMLVMMCSGIVYAEGCKIYPGVMGVRVNASQPVPTESWGASGNPSPTANLTMTLPVIRDCNHSVLENGWVRLIDQNYDKNISVRLCSVFHDGPNGKIYGTQSKVYTTSGGGPGVQTIYFSSLWANHSSSAYYYVVLPPSYKGNHSQVISYLLNED